jgi:hypothetical protein
VVDLNLDCCREVGLVEGLVVEELEGLEEGDLRLLGIC